jgi:hypothetical protein
MKSRYRLNAPLKKAARPGAVWPPPMRVDGGRPPSSTVSLRMAPIGYASSALIATPSVRVEHADFQLIHGFLAQVLKADPLDKSRKYLHLGQIARAPPAQMWCWRISGSNGVGSAGASLCAFQVEAPFKI